MDQNGEEELPAAAVRVDCSDQENLSECSISRKGSCPIRNIIHLNCTSKLNCYDQTAGNIRILSSHILSICTLYAKSIR